MADLIHDKANLSVRPSIMYTLDQVMRQVEYHCFADLRHGLIDRLFKELCLIIAEVLVLQPDSVIKVNGSFVSVHLVQEVYSNLTNDHLRIVFENFHHVSSNIYNKKAYLRTALYNAFFELEAHSFKGGC